MRRPITYRDAGVDINAGDSLIERIKPLAARTRTAGVLADVGGFAGMFRMPGGIDDPVLVSGTDGVGTKLKLAFELDAHDGIGADLVGMSVNDILTCGARPLFFLDYFATSKLVLDTATRVIAGIARACEDSGCALLGGETAEMPGMYAEGEYDLAGFAVGVVARAKIIDGGRVRAGDALVGLPSSGLHSNGYSLVRRIVETRSLDLHADVMGVGRPLGEALMTPTRLYAKAVRAVIEGGVDVRAMCHVTGGGLPGNLPRVLPDGLGVRIDLASFPRPKVFDLLARSGPVDEDEMRRTFNLGVGYAMVVPRAELDRALTLLRTAGARADAHARSHVDARDGEEPRAIGEVIAVDPATPFEERVRFEGTPP